MLPSSLSSAASSQPGLLGNLGRAFRANSSKPSARQPLPVPWQGDQLTVLVRLTDNGGGGEAVMLKLFSQEFGLATLSIASSSQSRLLQS